MTKKQKYESLPEHFQNMVITWKFPNVCHRDIEDFSHGALSRSRLANIMCELGEDEKPPTFKIMSKNASDIVDMAYFIFQRTEQMNSRGDS